MIAGGKINPAALATLPIAILLALSALLPYFDLDYYSSFDISGWSFFSSVDQLMVLGILLAAAVVAVALVPELKGGTVKVELGDRDHRAFEFPLTVVPAALLALLAGAIFLMIALRILSPPDELSPAVGIFFGALLAAALAASAAGTIVFEIAPPQIGGWGPAQAGPGPAAPVRPPQRQSPLPPDAQPTQKMPSPPPTEPPPPAAAEPPPPAPGTRRA